MVIPRFLTMGEKFMRDDPSVIEGDKFLQRETERGVPMRMASDLLLFNFRKLSESQSDILLNMS